MRAFGILGLTFLCSLATAHRLPTKLQKLYDVHKTAQCSKKLSQNFNGGMHYCGDIPKAIFLKGRRGLYDKMEVTCDGVKNSEGPCSKEPDRQHDTVFKGLAQAHGWPDLDAAIHSYVVFGNDDDKLSFNPQRFDMRPYGLVAVVCNDQVVGGTRGLFACPQRFYGLWGAINRKHDTGISSLALAKFCFPDDGLNLDNPHLARDIMYLGFTGDHAVPDWGRRYQAKWKAKNALIFQNSLRALGEHLIKHL